MEKVKTTRKKVCAGCEKPIKKGQRVYYVSKSPLFFCTPSCNTLYANRRKGLVLDELFWEELDLSPRQRGEKLGIMGRSSK